MPGYQNQHAKTQSLNHSIEISNGLSEDRNDKLKNALAEIKQLGGMLPICDSCKKIRYHSAVEFSHGICPECAKTYILILRFTLIKSDDS